MKKKLLLIFSLLALSRSFAQVVITEIYFDTPSLEDIYFYGFNGQSNPYPFYHHLGEYIELYNYSSEEIELKGWVIADIVSSYQFPNDAIIHPGEFIVLAYSPPGSNTPFSTYYPTTSGKEEKIY